MPASDRNAQDSRHGRSRRCLYSRSTVGEKAMSISFASGDRSGYPAASSATQAHGAKDPCCGRPPTAILSVTVITRLADIDPRPEDYRSSQANGAADHPGCSAQQIRLFDLMGGPRIRQRLCKGGVLSFRVCAHLKRAIENGSTANNRLTRSSAAPGCAHSR
ncbi:hypothetical protein PtA15_11A266 [Puccinia triticina]|uniref:Velvet domain-containing protein n=1 Tax=Puccinia triticina TaxID=208348 RepID=A0ABY7CZQ3_9BASI|nr:uncharacterized protein PtA15_11A266 [Puccinia triticina]WAQ89576.1 hypothetical protein PtA15_11A266 [Puccinia triticina]